MEILKNFGFDPVMLTAQIVNFLIIFYLLKRFLYKPIFEMLKKRKDTISLGQKQAEEARILLEKTLSEEKKILNKAKEEARIITDEAKKQAVEIAEEINQNSKKQNEKMLIEAKQQIEQESKKVEQKLTEKISQIAAVMLTKSLEKVLNEKEQKQILENALKNIKK